MKVGILGCGKMGTSLVGGAIQSGTLKADQVVGFEPIKGFGKSFTQSTGVMISHDLASVMKECSIIILAMKPQDLKQACEQIQAYPSDSQKLMVSIVAGVTTATLESYLPKGFRFIRVMPNTPAAVGAGASAYALGHQVTEQDKEFVDSFLKGVGLAIEVPERLMDVVTGLSGSGPAYGYVCIEAMAEGALLMGLNHADAIKLAAQTMLGAAKMVLETGYHPAVLKSQVTSPGGTTIAGLAALEQHGVRHALIDAVRQATLKSIDLGKL